jgi:hypothetical protein
MKKVCLALLVVMFLPPTASTLADELAVVCWLREDLNFNSMVQVIYLKVDIQKKTVNGIPSKVYDKDIITYETEAETLTFILPSMYLTVMRKGRGPDDSDSKYSGECTHDKLFFE